MQRMKQSRTIIRPALRLDSIPKAHALRRRRPARSRPPADKTNALVGSGTGAKSTLRNAVFVPAVARTVNDDPGSEVAAIESVTDTSLLSAVMPYNRAFPSPSVVPVNPRIVPVVVKPDTSVYCSVQVPEMS